MYEIELYKAKRIFIFSRPGPEDFVLDGVHKRKTKEEAFKLVKGMNLVVETVDAPYLPIKIFEIKGKKRNLIWEQEWSNV